MRPHGLAMRQAAITGRRQGVATTEIAAELGCSVRSVNRLWRRWCVEETLQTRPIPRRFPMIAGSVAEALATHLAAHPTRPWLTCVYGSTSPSTARSACRRCGAPFCTSDGDICAESAHFYPSRQALAGPSRHQRTPANGRRSPFRDFRSFRYDR